MSCKVQYQNVFDISNMYTNIPIDEVRRCMQSIMSTQGIDTTEIEQVFSLLSVVIEQNYF
jgi:hypothetical protein